MRTMATMIAVGLLWAAPAVADDGALRALLGSPDQVAAATTVRALDPAGEQLRRIVGDRRETRYLRMRAASWLALFDRAEVRAGLTRVVDASDDDVEVRAQALHALGLIEGGAATARLVRALESPEPALRTTAAIGLARVGTPAARAALHAHLTRELDAGIRGRIDASLRR